MKREDLEIVQTVIDGVLGSTVEVVRTIVRDLKQSTHDHSIKRLREDGRDADGFWGRVGDKNQVKQEGLWAGRRLTS